MALQCRLGRSLMGGFVYRVTALPDLVGCYVFGDFGSGRLFGFSEDSAAVTVAEAFGETGRQIESFGQGADAELSLLHFGGTMNQIVDAP